MNIRSRINESGRVFNKNGNIVAVTERIGLCLNFAILFFQRKKSIGRCRPPRETLIMIVLLCFFMAALWSTTAQAAPAPPQNLHFQSLDDIGDNVDYLGGFVAAVTRTGTTRRTLRVTSMQTIAASLIVPSNITVVVQGNGGLTLNDGIVITQNGPFFTHSLQQVFTGIGEIRFGQGAIERVYPQWWGAKSDGTDAAATVAGINKAIDSLQLSGGELHFIAGTYLVQPSGSQNTCIQVRWSEITLSGTGKASLIKSTNITDTIINISSNEDASQTSTYPSTVSNITVKNLAVQGVVGTFVDVGGISLSRGIHVNGGQNIMIRDNWITDMNQIGIDVIQGGYITITGNHVHDCLKTAINYNGMAYHSLISNNVATGSTGNINSVLIQVTGPQSVVGNTLYNSAGYGIMCGETPFHAACIVSNNIIYKTASEGIAVLSAGPANITGNYIVNAQGNGGILLGGNFLGAMFPLPSNNVVANNTIINSYPFGIFSADSGTIIQGNQILYLNPVLLASAPTNPDSIQVLSRYEAGIYLRGGPSQSIIGNFIDGANYALWLDPSLNNMVGTLKISANNTDHLQFGKYAWSDYGQGTTPISDLSFDSGQLNLTSGSPLPADCSALTIGLMKVDPSTGKLYICVDSGWVSK